MLLMGFLLSKKILVLFSAVMFSGVAFASSGVQTIFQSSGIITPQPSVPEVQKITQEEESPSPSPSQTAAKQSSAKPVVAASTVPLVKVTSKPSQAPVLPQPTVLPKAPAPAPALIPAARTNTQPEDDEESTNESQLYQAFQKARDTEEDDSDDD